MKLEAFDLFSGGGGFRQGAEKAGIRIVAHCEIDKWAEKFYRQAFNTTEELYFNDATKINTGKLPDFNILFAGFPCQAFSIAGKRQGFKDTRGTLFFDVARILSDKRPRYFILENVKGLLNHENGKTFQTILKILSDIGIYSIEWGVLNSKYFSVPQNRERVFIIGYPRKFGIGKIFPIRQASQLYNKTGENQKEVYNITSTLKARDYANWSGNFIKCITNINPSNRGQNGNVYSIAGISPAVTTNKGEGFKIYQLPRGNNKGGIKKECPTITKNQWEYNNLLIDVYNAKISTEGFCGTVGSIRRLTPLECFRLQGFSDEVVKKGREGISDAQLYKIAGNSVTVNVVYELIRKIVELAKEQQ